MSKLAALTAVLVLAAASHIAHAEAPAYVSAGGQVGNDLGLSSALNLDAGVPLLHTSSLLHLGVAKGSFNGLEEAVGSNDDSAFYRGQGSFLQGRLGVESALCTERGGGCLVYGADLGYLRTSASSGPWTDTPSVRYTEYQVIPRAGVDFGGQRLRARIMLDVEGGKTTRTQIDSMETQTRYDLQGMRLGGSVAYRF